MTYKSILVHLNASEHAHPRLELALRLARQFDAHLDGIYAMFTPQPQPLYVMAGTAEYYLDREPARLERRAALERLFHAEVTRAELMGTWTATNEHASVAVRRAGRCSDLIVASQNDPDDPESYVGDQFPENLIMSVGRPVLLMPYAGAFSSLGTHVMVAWDGSREATRAIHDALPFIRRARKTTVVIINEAKSGALANRIAGSDIAAFTARHGVNVEVHDVELAHGEAIGDVLLSQAADLGADLLVMGCYGHARWHELVMGGVTRTILKSMTVPVLMSH
ncbi:universal stress protein [Paraburkholderia megapolitana]|uniref:Universal stress protein family protein n=1 Tax=Paraburkholderia megapolitana TaxID=420953 RepID=A0A1I3Q2B6_9BURK|nr:universal stress protein [Paraburkholderia megapolitana]QDQ81095.1 universal stress protein [Paraburkholderia megapolitana]SFJ28013.1 Universal stress protein family protein [Paraburkholderia megapolitana]